VPPATRDCPASALSASAGFGCSVDDSAAGSSRPTHGSRRRSLARHDRGRSRARRRSGEGRSHTAMCHHGAGVRGSARLAASSSATCERSSGLARHVSARAPSGAPCTATCRARPTQRILGRRAAQYTDASPLASAWPTMLGQLAQHLAPRLRTLRRLLLPALLPVMLAAARSVQLGGDHHWAAGFGAPNQHQRAFELRVPGRQPSTQAPQRPFSKSRMNANSVPVISSPTPMFEPPLVSTTTCRR
jgi:hypothetical protein